MTNETVDEAAKMGVTDPDGPNLRIQPDENVKPPTGNDTPMNSKIIAIAVGLASVLAAPPARAETPVFPTLAAESLARQQVSLPGELAGRYNLVVIAYRRQQQADVDTWMPALSAIEAADSRFRWYELPTIGKLAGVFVSWWLDDAMRSGIPSQQQRARTITLYVDIDSFRARLGLPPNDEAIQLLLLDKAGRVLWRRSGRHDAVAIDDLEKTLRALE